MNEMNEMVPCHVAGDEVARNLGFAALAPHTARLVKELRECSNPACRGLPRVLLVGHVVETVMADQILALRN